MMKPLPPPLSPKIGLLAATLGLAAMAHASTVAYWRFEEAVAGPVPAGANGEAAFNNTILDSSGNGNHLRTYAIFTAPSYATGVPVSTIPLTGAANGSVLDFSPNQDIYASPGTSLPGIAFTAFTIEAYVNFDALGSWQTFIGRDDSGGPGQGVGAESLFYFQAMGDGSNKLRVQAVDSLNSLHNVQSLAALATNTWYHVAAVSDGTTLELYLDGVLQGSTAFTGGLFNPNPDTIWTLGRGQYNGGNGDFLNGKIDEVRFSDAALSSSQFLNAVPEPASAALAMLGACALLKRRR